MKPLPPEKYRHQHRYPSAKSSPLTRRQKAVLSILANQAYTHLDDDSETLTEFRHRIAIETVGCTISQAQQSHYLPLKAAYQLQAGHIPAATSTVVRQIDNPRRVALYKLRQNLADRGLDQAYAETICLTQYKTDLAGATAAQLWQLIYTIRNRRKPIP